MIGDEIKITIIEVSQGKVKLGISAPGHVSVHREEVWTEIQK
ncbi:MAG: carbon storage regulator, partial [Firmicutes bacterium]|nr:carbon storage regulator [Bacillota bacterium]